MEKKIRKIVMLRKTNREYMHGIKIITQILRYNDKCVDEILAREQGGARSAGSCSIFLFNH